MATLPPIAGTDTKVDREYARYAAVEVALARMTTKLNPKQAYEVRNAMERWLVGLANASGSQDAILSTASLDTSYPATRKMLSEMTDKRIPDVYRHYSDASVPLRAFLAAVEYPTVLVVEVEGLSVQIGMLSLSLHPQRAAYLTARGVPSLAALLLRYQSLLPGGQQWAVPLHVYSYLADSFHVTVEGFATPLNARCTLLDPTRYPGQRYCSLFPDTDAPYGSLGSFFTTSLYGLSVYCNPPFTPSVLQDTARYVNKACLDARDRQVRFFVVVPEWKDADWYLALQTSAYLAYETTFARGTHGYVDTNASPEVSIPASFSTHLFVLAANVPVPTAVPYSRLAGMWKG
jgi:hypothetical protein